MAYSAVVMPLSPRNRRTRITRRMASPFLPDGPRRPRKLLDGTHRAGTAAALRDTIAVLWTGCVLRMLGRSAPRADETERERDDSDEHERGPEAHAERDDDPGRGAVGPLGEIRPSSRPQP